MQNYSGNQRFSPVVKASGLSKSNVEPQ